ncbi:ABC transporter substrate-binding protein [Zobellella denitrificans]|uniref:ABC transporter substrate-binding protein n=1 Tax=Zobellella denitrificans TaxID=347534 RepID=A0A231MZL7_9GAMM|nr:tripartite tricarboxylate transporter substrate binding protein [Zobellella denitrificans]ATG74894.1 ABC transporter substrate-binding protein [Zobellella denitrificans]OXS15681.1 ABC transporter substrate-binding protein [Zobellella denitrificans]
MELTRRRFIGAAMAAAALLAGGVQADGYPSKPVSIVVSYPPGGDVDAIARLFADKLTSRLGQPVIVENRPGAAGTIGNSYVSRAKADGHTLLFTPNTFTTAPLVMALPKESRYDVLNGFEPVILASKQSVLLVANPKSGISSVADLVSQSRDGKRLNYASPGAGSPMHIAAEWLNSAADIKVLHIPYRGIGPIIPDLLAGHVDLGYVVYGPVAQLIESGQLVPVAVTDPERSPVLPELATVAEQGYDQVRLGAWHGLMAPKGTPDEVVRLLNQHLNEILQLPEVAEQLASFGAVPVGGEPEALGAINADDHARLSALIEQLDIRGS